jgi:tRNA-dihydrouridine synthase B
MFAGRTPSFRIGNVELKTRVIPAPMCNVSDRPYRGLTRSMGADLVTTQMVSCEGLIRDDPNTWRLLDLDPEEKPVAVQLLGSDPDRLAQAAQILEAKGATIIDFNMGCPARHVTGNACGSALMKDPALVAEIVRKISNAISVPFTVKMRAGWSDKEISAMELGRICEGEGAKAIALHARTREQGYKGFADWSLIAAMKQAVSIPVIGNGDVKSPADAVRMFRETGCDAVMLGRGIIGNPWLLRACEKAVLDLFSGRVTHEDQVPGDEMVLVEDNGEFIPIKVPFYMKNVPIQERLDLILRHTMLTVQVKGEQRGIREMRKHSQHYMRGIPGCKSLREKLMTIETYSDIEGLITEYRAYLASRKPMVPVSPDMSPADVASATGASD